MMELLLIKHLIAFCYLLAGSISDFKIREVSDWANYGLISIGVAANLIASIAFDDWHYIVYSLIGLAAFWLIALLMFYTGQWGGGDSKMLMGLGALYGFGFTWSNSSFLVYFLMNTLIAGAVYGIVWSMFLAIKNRKKFAKEYTKNSGNKIAKRAKILVFAVAILLLCISFLFGKLDKILLMSAAVLVIAIYYLWILIKSVENSSMFKLVEPDKLTEGDWIAEEVKYQGEYICGPDDLGIEKSQIRKLKKLYNQGKIKKIIVKEGIPFVPSFMLGWIITVFIGNLLNLLLI